MDDRAGLDFGTSTTLVAAGTGIVWIGTESVSWMPSLVGYNDDGDIVVGEDARSARVGQLIRSLKRAITTRRRAILVEAPAGLPNRSADDLIVEVLKEAARRARREGLDLSEQPELRLGCPAMWDGLQRRRLLEVAHRAGLRVTLASLVDEPVAAGVAWLDGHPGRGAGPLRVLVFDMGGGTLDIAVLDVGGDGRSVTVLAAVGVAEAGDLLDETIAEDLDEALALAGIDIDLLPDARVTQELLLDAARKLKFGLSIVDTDVVVLPAEVFGPNEIWYTREQLEAAFTGQLDRAEESIAAALRAARLNDPAPGAADDLARIPVDDLVVGVDVVVLSGGMSRIPYVGQRMRELFPPGTRIELACPQPEEAVARGLSRMDAYERINRHRPAFDVLLEWDQGRQSQVIYEAYRPLVESYQIVRGDSDLRYIRTGGELSLPGTGQGTLRVLSYADGPVRLSLDGVGLDGFGIALNGSGFEFSLYPSGRVRVIDGAGTHHGEIHYP